MKYVIPFFIILFTSTNYANAQITKYYCNGEANQFFIKFDTKKKIIVTNKGKPNKYWTENNYSFWHSANDLTLYEYTYKNSYNKLSGILKVKSHHLVTGENRWYDYECSINQ